MNTNKIQTIRLFRKRHLQPTTHEIKINKLKTNNETGSIRIGFENTKNNFGQTDVSFVNENRREKSVRIVFSNEQVEITTYQDTILRISKRDKFKKEYYD